MNVFPHMNLTLARLASETLKPLKHLIFEIFIYCFLRLLASERDSIRGG